MLSVPSPPGDGGPQIQIIRPGLYDTTEFTVVELFKMSIILDDVMMLEDDNFVVSGAIGIMDFTNVTKQHFHDLDSVCVKKVAKLSQEAQPTVYVSFHYINTSSQFEEIFNMFKGYMSRENRRRVRLFRYFYLWDIRSSVPKYRFDHFTVIRSQTHRYTVRLCTEETFAERVRCVVDLFSCNV